MVRLIIFIIVELKMHRPTNWWEVGTRVRLFSPHIGSAAVASNAHIGQQYHQIPHPSNPMAPETQIVVKTRVTFVKTRRVSTAVLY